MGKKSRRLFLEPVDYDEELMSIKYRLMYSSEFREELLSCLDESSPNYAYEKINWENPSRASA